MFSFYRKEKGTLIEQNTQYLTDKFTHDIQTMTEQSKRINDDCDNISLVSERVKATINEIIELSNLTSNSVKQSAKEGFLNLVRLDHAIWKLSIYNKIAEKDFDTNAIPDHCHCRLGKWYYEGEGALNYSNNSSFKLLEQPHADVHIFGKQAVEAMQQGNADLSVDLLHKMEDASIGVVNYLSDLEN